jgi:putative transposase
MPHSYSSFPAHYAFSAKDRRKTITPEIRDDVWAYHGGIARENEVKTLAIGGTEDHVHMLVSRPGALSIAKAVRLLKGGSSKWVHETFAAVNEFAWQAGYSAFSISISGVDDTVACIQNQAENHRVKTFEDEFVGFLKRHGLAFDTRLVFG